MQSIGEALKNIKTGALGNLLNPIRVSDKTCPQHGAYQEQVFKNFTLGCPQCAREQEQAAEAQRQLEEAKAQKEAEKQAAKEEAARQKELERLQREVEKAEERKRREAEKAEERRARATQRVIESTVKSVGTTAARSLTRSILGTLFK